MKTTKTRIWTFAGSMFLQKTHLLERQPALIGKTIHAEFAMRLLNYLFWFAGQAPTVIKSLTLRLIPLCNIV